MEADAGGLAEEVTLWRLMQGGGQRRALQLVGWVVAGVVSWWGGWWLGW